MASKKTRPGQQAYRPEQMSLVTTIIERGSGNKLMKLYTDNQVFTHIRCEGTGTATSEILDILGLGSSEKDIIFSLTPISVARQLLDRLDDELRGAAPGRGIAYTMPLTAVSNLLAAVVTMSTKTEKENGGSHDMDKGQKNSLVLILVNQGFTGPVMETDNGAPEAAPLSGDAGWAMSRRNSCGVLPASRRRRCCLLWRRRRSAVRSWTPSTKSTAS